MYTVHRAEGDARFCTSRQSTPGDDTGPNCPSMNSPIPNGIPVVFVVLTHV